MALPPHLRTYAFSVSLTIMILPSSCGISIWHLLQNCDLNLLVVQGFQDNSMPPFFSTILYELPYSPRLLNIGSYNATDIYGLDHFGANYGFPRNGASSSRCSAGIVTLDHFHLKYIQGHTLSFLVLYYFISYVNPHYVFAHVDSTSNPDYYQGYSFHLGFSKLILWNTYQSETIKIPCIASVHSAPVVNLEDIPSLQDIDTRWNVMNGNMHRKLLWTRGFPLTAVLHPKSKFSCGPNFIWFKEGDAVSCTMSVLETKYNLSLSTTRPKDETEFRRLKVGAELRMDIIDMEYRGRPVLQRFTYRIELIRFKFVVVTYPPTAISSFVAIFSPFDGWTWIFLGLSMVGVTAGIQVQSLADEQYTKVGKRQDFLDIAALLLSQTCSGKLFQTRYITGIIIILLMPWTLICFILLNNLYGGEVFASLTVTSLPNVPRSLEQLAVSNLPIFTTTSFSRRGVQNSSLTWRIIPELAAGYAGNSKLLRFLEKIKSKLIFVNWRRDLIIDNRDLYPIPLLPHGCSTNQTFAILDEPVNLYVVLGTGSLLGKRFVIPAQEPWSPFFTINTANGNKNYFSPQLYATLSQLLESGIKTRWEKVDDFVTLSNKARIVWEEKHSQFLTKYMVAPTKSAFIEFEPVSLTVVKYIFVITFLILLLGLVLFAMEVFRRPELVEKL